MITDALTKAEVKKSNAALQHLMRTGTLELAKEEESLALRASCKEAKGRSFNDSLKLLEGRCVKEDNLEEDAGETELESGTTLFTLALSSALGVQRPTESMASCEFVPALCGCIGLCV